jgi:hypothetical protein
MKRKFYVPKDEYDGSHRRWVYTKSGDHFSKGWITCGFVSRQTPFGQGTYCGFRRSELREATADEVLDTLKKDHPHGSRFRPSCREAMDAEFHLVMSKAVRNWTNDSAGSNPPVHNFSRKDLEDFRDQAMQRHMEMLARWDEITAEQTAEIEKQFQQEAER